MDNMAYICLYKSYLRTLSTLTDAQFGKLFRSLLLFSQDGQQPSLSGPLRHVWPGIAEQYLRDAQQYEIKVEANRANGAKGARKRKENAQATRAQAVTLGEDSIVTTENSGAKICTAENSGAKICTTENSGAKICTSENSEAINQKANLAKEKEKEKEKAKENTKAKEKESVSIPPAGRGAGREEAAGPVSGALAFLPPTLDTIAAYIKAQGLDAKAEEFWDYYEARGWKMGASPMQDWKAALRAWARAERRFTNGKADAERVFSQGARYGDFGAVV